MKQQGVKMLSEIKTEKFQKSASYIMKEMRDLEEFCDVTLVSEDRERIRAHRVVLASASTTFRDIFQSEEDNSEYQVIHMKGIKSVFMKAMVDLIYEGETRIQENKCEEFLNILEQYKLLKYNLKRKKNKANICRYHNKGFCKVGSDCEFNHPEEDCERHMAGNLCSVACSKRHRQICKFWKSSEGCFWKSECQYLHKDPRYKKSRTSQTGKERCDLRY